VIAHPYADLLLDGKRLRLAELVQAAPGREERLLRRVLGQLELPQHGIGIAIGEVLVLPHDLVEGRGMNATPLWLAGGTVPFGDPQGGAPQGGDS